MRIVPPSMTAAWLSEDKTGENAPMLRATIQKMGLQNFHYDTGKVDGGDYEHQRNRKGHLTSVIFGSEPPCIELRNLKSIRWGRSVDQDVATCTLTIKNVERTAVGTVDDEHQDEFDQPGAFTPTRGWDLKSLVIEGGDGQSPSGARWGYENERGWRNLIVPDRLVRTYEGYGHTPGVPPALDGKLKQSGTWLIDKVTYTSSGDIEVEMRDVGRMLLTSIVFPPVVPFSEYPMVWSAIRSEEIPARDAKGGKWSALKGLATATSSNDAYIGEGLTDPPYAYYVNSNGAVQGRLANMALDDGGLDWANPGDTPPANDRHWISTGQTSKNSFVWWQAEFNNLTDVAALRIDPIGGPYRIYISIRTDDGWVGNKKIPYSVTTEDIDNGARIPFVQAVWADKWNRFDVIFKRKYRNVRKIRLTFTKLDDTRVGDYPWRAKLNWVKAYTGNYDDMYFEDGTKLAVVGNYRDYTQIVKWICAWGGFFWPPANTERDFYTIDGENKLYLHQDGPDGTLPYGRVWGDFQRSGTASEVDLTVDMFDKKPLMDVINYIRDLLGFIFMVDETGGAIWRMPNLWEAGNYVSPEPHSQNARSFPGRTQQYVTLDEKTTLLDLSTTLSSENVRERIFIANTTGKIGIVIRGYNPTFEGFRRTAGWTDQHFKTQRETRVMADMIAAQQMFDYRRSVLTTPGYPAIQIDDQIRVFERTTNETYWHYVLGIESELDLETGEWFYTLQTHWLGQDREDAWVIDPTVLDAVTIQYLGVLRGTSDMKNGDDWEDA